MGKTIGRTALGVWWISGLDFGHVHLEMPVRYPGGEVM